MVFECSRRHWFCFICGHYELLRNRKGITESLEESYRLYFGKDIEQMKNKPWVPDKICATCSVGLHSWSNGDKSYLRYKIPMVWMDPGEHNPQNCYFCVNETFGYSSKNLRKIDYKGVPSVEMPVIRERDEEVPPPPRTYSPPTDVVGLRFPLPSSDPDFVPTEIESSRPILMSQLYFNDLVRDLGLTKNKAELLGSRLSNLRLLEPNVRITQQRVRSNELQVFFDTTGNLVYCKDITSVMEYLDVPTDSEEWRLFIDSSKESLKGVLLHNGNLYPAIPIAYSNQKEESYENIANLLNHIRYKEYNWKICGDLKIVAIVSGLQQGYTKHMCFICMWNSRDTSQHYHKRDWELRSLHKIGRLNVIKDPLVPRDNILLPPLHIKLGIMKNFIKALDRNGPAFQYLYTVFPHISTAKLKEGMFILQIFVSFNFLIFFSITFRHFNWTGYSKTIERSYFL